MNWWIWLMGIVYWLVETQHFGWNAWPQSDTEVLADGIAGLIFALAMLRPAQNSNVEKPCSAK